MLQPHGLRLVPAPCQGTSPDSCRFIALNLDFICPHVLGWCHITRNVVLGGIAGYLAKVGAGPYSLDSIRARQHIPGYKRV